MTCVYNYAVMRGHVTENQHWFAPHPWAKVHVVLWITWPGGQQDGTLAVAVGLQ